MSEHMPVRLYMTPMPETIDEDLELADAKSRMFDHGIRHLPVTRAGQLVGIVSQRDIAVAESLTVMSPQQIPVGRIMTQAPFTCGPEAHVEAVAREMAAHRYGSAIVVERDHPSHVVGVFTTTDALRALAEILDAHK